jgi:hypothetical protein
MINKTATERRLNNARTALSIYDEEPLEIVNTTDNMVDLVTDLRHLAANMGVDFEDVLTLSEIHYDAEKKEA